MKNIKHVFYILLIAGCATTGSNSFATIAGKFLTTTVLTVDATMQGWAQWVKLGKATQSEIDAVATAYREYQAYGEAATNAYVVAIQLSDASMFTPASNNLQNAQTKLTILAKTH